ncbi:ABC transporter permease [Actinocrinis puniceicyclus]|uniref:ABC transporter permease n=1 Tax=Actinocrinis puniceicyclus TaxID=977794 RepID=A0A8J7WKA2_9ACTN|nr:ABC transporter permease [Actinocrinis puniceicyclus]MBS2963856.1 ABC transporter permease [Actinocrinis puniceicyclus]
MPTLIRRLMFYAVTAFVAISMNFFLPHMMPGNPVQAMLAAAGPSLDHRAVAALQAQFGVGTGQSLMSQYWSYWINLLHGDLGISISHSPDTVTTVIGSSLWWTVVLVGTATVLSFIIGTLVGTIVGWRRGSVLDQVLPTATFFQAIPYFFLATVFLYFFAEQLHWFPADFKGYDTNNYVIGWNPGFIGSAVQHAILPALTIVVSSVAGWIVGMRNMMVTTMDEDYVLVAQAKGLPNRRVIYYAARNAVLPSISGFANALSFVVAGSLLTELVFSYPGLGNLLLSAVTNVDYPLIQGIFLIITFAVLAANLLADTVYVLLDPRTRQEA